MNKELEEYIDKVLEEVKDHDGKLQPHKFMMRVLKDAGWDNE